MEGQFQVDRGGGVTTPEGYEAASAIEASRRGRGWQFVDEFQRLVGEDSEPDIRFFVESWTSGTATAVESYEQRRKKPPQREYPNDAFCEDDVIDTVSFVHEKAPLAEFAAAASEQANAGCSGGGSARESSIEPAAQTQEEAWQEWEMFAEERDDSSGAVRRMTQERACLLLGLTATSTRRQIKAAYRRMVSRWHPDRLDLGTEEVRQLANERMAAINEAYHLLLNGLR